LRRDGALPARRRNVSFIIAEHRAGRA